MPRVIHFPMPKTATKKEFAGVRLEPALKVRLERVATNYGIGNFSEAVRFAVLKLCEDYEQRSSPDAKQRRTG